MQFSGLVQRHHKEMCSRSGSGTDWGQTDTEKWTRKRHNICVCPWRHACEKIEALEPLLPTKFRKPTKLSEYLVHIDRYHLFP